MTHRRQSWLFPGKPEGERHLLGEAWMIKTGIDSKADSYQGHGLALSGQRLSTIKVRLPLPKRATAHPGLTKQGSMWGQHQRDKDGPVHQEAGTAPSGQEGTCCPQPSAQLTPLAPHSGGLVSSSEPAPGRKPLSRSHSKGYVGAPLAEAQWLSGSSSCSYGLLGLGLRDPHQSLTG